MSDSQNTDAQLYQELKAKFEAGEATAEDVTKLKSLDPAKYPFTVVEDE